MQSAGPKRRIGLIFIEWAGAGETKVIVNWTSIGNQAEAKTFADGVMAAPRPFYGRTSIAGAIEVGMEQLRTSPLKSDRRVIDISGDGTNNAGRDVTEARDTATNAGVVINGIVIFESVSSVNVLAVPSGAPSTCVKGIATVHLSGSVPCE